MKKIGIAAVITAAFLACAEQEIDSNPVNNTAPPVEQKSWELPSPATCGYTPTAMDTDGWKLVWEDNFDANLSKWLIWKAGAFNNELQLYREQNLILKDGYLFIKGTRENFTGQENPFSTSMKNFEFTSGRIESAATFGASNSESVKMVARIQQPVGAGLWTAFWSYNDPWPTQGEIDIMEYRGNSPNKFETCYHFGRQVNNLETDFNKNSFKYELEAGEKTFAECFYIYELEWFKDRFDMKVNGKLIKSYKEPQHAFINAFNNKKHRVILNMAIGGDFFQNLDKSSIPDNSAMIVDWVKVYTQ